jgi:hypothetical protein
MSLLLAPLLAQSITLGVADRTEARYLTPNDYAYEASTTPGARLTLHWPRYDVVLGYDASLTLAPLEKKPRNLLAYHTLLASAQYRARQSSLTLSTSATFGEVNFRAQALGQTSGAAPGAEPGQPPSDQGAEPDIAPSPGSAPPEAQPQTQISATPTRHGTWSSTLAAGHQPTREVTLASSVTYTISGGLNADAREDYPVTRGLVVGLFGTHAYKLSARDTLASSAGLQQAWSSVDVEGARSTQVTSLVAGETWSHRFNKRTSSLLGVGLSFSRQPLGVYTAWSLYPTFTASLLHEARVARGVLSLSLTAFSAPELDPLRATVDPRIGSTASAGWTRDRFFTSLSASASLSIAHEDNDAGAFDQRQAAAVAGYRLTDWLLVDGGGRLAELQYQDAMTIPLTYAAFVGLTFGYVVPLVGRQPLQ